MGDPVEENEKITIDGQMLTGRVWSLINQISGTIGKPLSVGQGGFKDGSGASASGSTHDKGDVFDLRVKNLNEHERLEVVQALRFWNGCAWLRTPEYGWTSTGPHIHCVMRDSYYELSGGAKRQVISYDQGKNGLDNGAPDPFHQPTQHHYSEEDVALTDAEIDKIADKVWAKEITWAWNGKKSTALATLNSGHYYSVSAAVPGDVPATAGTAPGQPTALQKILDGASGNEATTLTEKDVARVALAVVELLSKRLDS